MSSRIMNTTKGSSLRDGRIHGSALRWRGASGRSPHTDPCTEVSNAARKRGSCCSRSSLESGASSANSPAAEQRVEHRAGMVDGCDKWSCFIDHLISLFHLIHFVNRELFHHCSDYNKPFKPIDKDALLGVDCFGKNTLAMTIFDVSLRAVWGISRGEHGHPRLKPW